MYEVFWTDLELGEQFTTITTEKGVDYLLNNPTEYEVYYVKEVEEN